MAEAESGGGARVGVRRRRDYRKRRAVRRAGARLAPDSAGTVRRLAGSAQACRAARGYSRGLPVLDIGRRLRRESSVIRKGSHVRGHKNRWQAIPGCCRRKDQSRTDCCGRRPGDHDRPGARSRQRRRSEGRRLPWWPAPLSRPRVVSHGRHDKVRIFKMRRRKHYQKRQGHRQNFTEICKSARSTR